MEELVNNVSINWWAIVGATTVAFAIGAVWYGALLRDQWVEEQNFSKLQLKRGQRNDIMVRTSLFSLGINAAQAFVLVLFLQSLAISTAVDGLLFGLFIGTVFVAGSLAINFAYAMKTPRLFAIDAGYLVLIFGVMSLMLAIW